MTNKVAVATPYEGEYWIAPTSPGSTAPREWRSNGEDALEDATHYAKSYQTEYEVYKRTHVILLSEVLDPSYEVELAALKLKYGKD